MKACVFIGPSLGRDTPRSTDRLTVLPPAARGDLYRAACRGPRLMGLVDGYFDGVPAVAHKEILWAVEQGIEVLGAASMGALRAAELATFGMVGVGTIWRDYASGELEADDEVAVLHGPAETGWLAVSEALVNIRATIRAALRGGILSTGAADAVVEAARSLFYKDRRWELVLATAHAAGVDPAVLERLAAWLPEGRVDAKREDALLLLAEIDRRLEEIAAPRSRSAPFERTQIWADIVAEAGEEAADTQAELADLLLAELRLRPEEYRPIRDHAVARLLAEGVGGGSGASHDARPWIERFRAGAGLLRRTELEAWLAAREVDAEWLERQAQSEALLDTIAAAERSRLSQLCLDRLRLEVDYPERLRRAARRRELLAMFEGEGMGRPLPSRAALLGELSRGLGELGSFDELARTLDFANVDELYRALLAEQLYSAYAEAGDTVGLGGNECATGGR